MSTSYTSITFNEMDEFLTNQGFAPLTLPNTRELVYARGYRVDDVRYSVRVYTTIEHGFSRPAGGDSIKVTLHAKYASGETRALGSEIRVHRTQNWRENLQSRLNNWQSMLPAYVEGVKCPQCGSPMVKRNGRKGEFYGCADFPTCRGLVNPSKTNQPQQESVVLPGIVELFRTAAANLKFPKIVFEVGGQTVKLSLAGPSSRNKGSVNITDGGKFGDNTYFGRIGPDGSLYARDELTAEIREFLVALSAAPAETIDTYGKKTGCCMFCSTPLTRSATHGYGETCALSWGLPYDRAEARRHAKHLAAQSRDGQELVS